MRQPTVMLIIGDEDNESAIAFSEKGEVLEAVEWLDGHQPDWTSAGICDHRGAGGPEGFMHLNSALWHAEENAKEVGLQIVRVPDDVDEREADQLRRDYRRIADLTGTWEEIAVAAQRIARRHAGIVSSADADR